MRCSNAKFRRFIPAGAGNTKPLNKENGILTVHPRGRGEHGRAVIHGHDPHGSSPRARGTPYGSRADHRGWTVHPRGRGEHCCRVREHAGQPGSSPRARGTPEELPMETTGGRFIPAGAGNTLGRRVLGAAISVHPRGRGEHVSGRFLGVLARGSSPRARGTLRHLAAGACAPRFIPAGAGNTTGAAQCVRSISVHPRGRGEHRTGSRVRKINAGSSPRARGTPYEDQSL